MSRSPSPSEVLYQEWVPAGLLVRLTVFLAAALLLALAITYALTLPGKEGVVAAAISAGSLLVVLALLWNFRGIRITVTRRVFEARYGLLNRTRIPLDTVLACRPDTASFRRYWGIGVRFGTDGSFAYTTFFGPAVRIERAARRTFVVSSRDPAALCAAIREGMPSSRPPSQQ